jgi:hypothetical protein
LGIYDDLGDPAFKTGQLTDATTNLADDVTKWDPGFKSGVHGVILIAGSSRGLIDAALDSVKDIFNVGTEDATITEVKTLHGHRRPGAENGHEQ